MFYRERFATNPQIYLSSFPETIRVKPGEKKTCNRGYKTEFFFLYIRNMFFVKQATNNLRKFAISLIFPIKNRFFSWRTWAGRQDPSEPFRTERNASMIIAFLWMPNINNIIKKTGNGNIILKNKQYFHIPLYQDLSLHPEKGLEVFRQYTLDIIYYLQFFFVQSPPESIAVFMQSGSFPRRPRRRWTCCRKRKWRRII